MEEWCDDAPGRALAGRGWNIAGFIWESAKDLSRLQSRHIRLLLKIIIDDLQHNLCSSPPPPIASGSSRYLYADVELLKLAGKPVGPSSAPDVGPSSAPVAGPSLAPNVGRGRVSASGRGKGQKRKRSRSAGQGGASEYLLSGELKNRRKMYRQGQVIPIDMVKECNDGVATHMVQQIYT